MIKEENIAKRNPFNLFISIGSLPFKFQFDYYTINLYVLLDKHQFVCIFGQTWDKCESSTFVYDQDLLLCRLREFWKECFFNTTFIYTLSKSFIDQFDKFDINKKIKEDFYKEFFSEKGLLYRYFHEDIGYYEIAMDLDLLITRCDYFSQLFYYHFCTDMYPNLPIDFKITLMGLFFIDSLPLRVNLIYHLIE